MSHPAGGYQKDINKIDKDMEKPEPHIECEILQMLWKTIWQFLQRLNIGLPYDQQFYS